MEVDDKILNDILAELKEIKVEIKELKEERDVKPEYVEKLKKINSEQGKVFETKEKFDKYMDEL